MVSLITDTCIVFIGHFNILTHNTDVIENSGFMHLPSQLVRWVFFYSILFKVEGFFCVVCF